MIGIGFKVQIKKSKVITEPARTLAMPLVEATQLLADRILSRVANGMGPEGPWDTYASGSGPPPEGKFFWVSPNRPQPGTGTGKDGLVFRVKTGRFAGWAAYESVRAYYELRGMAGEAHDFQESGELLQKAAVRIISARHVRLAFYGGHKSGKTAKQIAWLVSRNERFPLLMPSKSEVQEVQTFLTGKITEAIAKAGQLSEGAQKLASKTRGLNRRTSKLLGD